MDYESFNEVGTDYDGADNLTNITTNWENYVGLQYTDRGNVSGIDGSVDRDIYTKEIFLNDSEEVPATENPNDTINTESINYTVQRGDTLWRIARRYEVSVRYIVRLNGITNPNLIFHGRILKI